MSYKTKMSYETKTVMRSLASRMNFCFVFSLIDSVV